MNKKYQQPAAIAGAVLVLIVLVTILFSDVGQKLGKLATITGNIATNIAHAEHGDTRSLDMMTADHIEANTGSTSETKETNLPKAFQPMKKVKHPPFSMGACAICHAPTQKNPAAILYKTVAGLCYKCHEPILEPGVKRDTKLDCNKCHSPHHADRKKLLRNKVTERECPAGEF